MVTVLELVLELGTRLELGSRMVEAEGVHLVVEVGHLVVEVVQLIVGVD